MAHRRFLMICLALLTVPGLCWGSNAELVSPGSPLRFVEILGRCPTFSWSNASPGVEHELAVFHVPGEQASLEALALEPLVLQRLPRGATSWTAPFEAALEPGLRYAWAIREIGDEKSASAWSDPAFFLVSERPSLEEVEAALETLRRYAGDEAASDGAPLGSQIPFNLPALAAPYGSPGGQGLAGEDVGLRFFGPYRRTIEIFNTETTGTPLGILVETTDSDAIGTALRASTWGSGYAVWGTATGSGDGTAGNFVGEFGARGAVVSSNVCCDGNDPDNYAAMVDNYTSAGGGDVLALQMTGQGLPAGDSNYIAFMADTGATLVGEIEGDGAGGVNYKGGRLSLFPTDVPEACSAALEGRVYYDDSENNLCVCDGSSWVRVDNGTGC